KPPQEPSSRNLIHVRSISQRILGYVIIRVAVVLQEQSFILDGVRTHDRPQPPRILTPVAHEPPGRGGQERHHHGTATNCQQATAQTALPDSTFRHRHAPRKPTDTPRGQANPRRTAFRWKRPSVPRRSTPRGGLLHGTFRERNGCECALSAASPNRRPSGSWQGCCSPHPGNQLERIARCPLRASRAPLHGRGPGQQRHNRSGPPGVSKHSGCAQSRSPSWGSCVSRRGR
ncbi:hypothetical protein PROPJV5_0736, partial [Propionibacterium ruminifibrarum]